LALLVSHPCDKDKDIAWMGHGGVVVELARGKSKYKSNGNDTSGFPEGMTERKARAKTDWLWWFPTHAIKTKTSHGWGTEVLWLSFFG
jgi:hypothetical protein